MDEIILKLIEIISTGLSPIGFLFFVIAAFESWFIITKLREQTEKEKQLFEQLQELQKIHNDTIKALQESRIEDLKELLDKYDDSVKAITDVLKKLSK